MSKEFVDYLNEDGINLPNVPDGMPVSPFDPRYVKSDKDEEEDGEWDDFEGEQAEENCKGYEPLAVIKRNHHKPLAVVDLEAFILLNRKEDDTNRS